MEGFDGAGDSHQQALNGEFGGEAQIQAQLEDTVRDLVLRNQRLHAGLVKAVDDLSALAPRSDTGSIRGRKIAAAVNRANAVLTAPGETEDHA